MIVEELTETRHEVQMADSTVCYLSVGNGPTVLLAHSYIWTASSEEITLLNNSAAAPER